MYAAVVKRVVKGVIAGVFTIVRLVVIVGVQ
jgi:hypothetical protein